MVMEEKWRRIFGFVVVSGIGWCIDLGLYSGLVLRGQQSPFLANLLSAGTAVSFVFFVSVYKIFLRQRRRLVLGGFLVYCAYQCIAILCFSYLINLTSHVVTERFQDADLSRILTKFAFTPLTLLLNYLFMRYLAATLLASQGPDPEPHKHVPSQGGSC